MGAPAAPRATRRAAGGKAAGKAAPTPAPVEQIPAELRNFYDQVEQDADDDVSLDMVSPSTEVQEAAREKLFSIDGVDYLIPSRFGPHLGLTYIKGLEDGQDVAIGRVMRAALGPAGWSALCDFQHLSTPQLKKLMGVIMQKVMGAVEDEEGNG